MESETAAQKEPGKTEAELAKLDEEAATLKEPSQTPSAENQGSPPEVTTGGVPGVTVQTQPNPATNGAGIGNGTGGSGVSSGAGAGGTGAGIGGSSPVGIPSMAARAAAITQGEVAQNIGANKQLHAAAQAEAAAQSAAQSMALAARQAQSQVLANGGLFAGAVTSHFGIKYGTSGVLGGILGPMKSMGAPIQARSKFYASKEGGSGAYFERQRQDAKDLRLIRRSKKIPPIGKEARAELANAQLRAQDRWERQLDSYIRNYLGLNPGGMSKSEMNKARKSFGKINNRPVVQSDDRAI